MNNPLEHPRLPITAYGLCSGLGRTTADCLAELRAGRRGLREVPFEIPFEARTGTVPGALEPLPEALQGYDSRTARLAALGYAEIADAVDASVARWGARRVALVLGTSTGGIDTTESVFFGWHDQGCPVPARLPTAFTYPTQHPFHAFLDAIAILSGIAGPRWVISTACSSSAKVFSSARRLLALDLADAVLVGGVDGLCNTTVRGFHSLGVMSPEPCRPFGENRPGMNVGEAGAFLLIEREGNARAWLRGVGETSDAYHMSSPEPEGAGALQAMRDALAEAGVAADVVDYVNAHGTGTTYNDAAESIALHTLFGEHVPVVSTKAYTGHTLGACGAVEAIFSIAALEQGWIPAALGADPVDPDIHLHLPQQVLETDVRFALSNAFAFGGNNASVLFERAEAGR